MWTQKLHLAWSLKVGVSQQLVLCGEFSAIIKVTGALLACFIQSSLIPGMVWGEMRDRKPFYHRETIVFSLL